MDWSLVLVSQGIETTVSHDPEPNQWGLLVEPADYERALHTLHLYRHENRSRGWQRELPWPGLIFDGRSVGWFLLLIVIFAFDAAGGGRMREAGLMHSAAVRQGEVWRLLTATMLHADVAHLAANATTGILLLGLAMGAFGSGPALLASVLAGVAGNVAGLLVYPDTHRGLGASGAVLGALGLLTAQSVMWVRTRSEPKQLIARGLAGGFLLLILLGFSPAPHTDVLAHVAGFVAGVIFGAALSFAPHSALHRTWVNRTAEVVCALLVGISWWLALR